MAWQWRPHAAWDTQAAAERFAVTAPGPIALPSLAFDADLGGAQTGSEFPKKLKLSALDGDNGFKVTGGATDGVGADLTAAGDVNGDGIGDFITGATGAGGDTTGAAYVVFGTDAGFDAAFDVTTVNGSDGFKLSGAQYDFAGIAVSSAGDFNGDGFADVMVSTNQGRVSIVLGKANGFAADTDLTSLDGHDGTNFSGGGTGFGYSVSHGDINGDGIDDAVFGTPRGGFNHNGWTYVVFGKTHEFGPNFFMNQLHGGNGFRFTGRQGDYIGAVSATGDINGDGFDDVVIGGSDYAGAAYVIFGKEDGFENLAVGDLDGIAGFSFKIKGSSTRLGESVAIAGDVNGDGFDDLILGAPRADGQEGTSGAAYVVFGKESFTELFNLKTLDGDNGFVVRGVTSGDKAGQSVSGAGDVNGDGFADIIVGAKYADPNGTDSGTAYIVFGKAGGFDAHINPASLDGENGFTLTGVANDDQAGISVSSVGDVNGDGFDDLSVGANTGKGYIFFGVAPDGPVTRIGSDAGQAIHGGDFNDTLKGLDGDDFLFGGGGKDKLTGGRDADTLFGGAQTDTFVFANAGESSFAHYDTIGDFDGAAEHIDLAFAVAGVDAPKHANSLNALKNVLDDLHSHHAVVVTLNGGDVFLVVDANGDTGYQQTGDLLIHLEGNHLSAVAAGTFV